MTRTMGVFAWIVIGSVICHSTGVFGLEISLSANELRPDARTGSSDNVRAAEMTLDDGFDTTEASSSAKLRQESSENCEHFDIKGGYRTLQIREIRSKDYSFFLQPKGNFVRLLFQLEVQSILDASDVINTEENIEFHGRDLGDPQTGWVKVHVQYFEHSSRGPNSHGLRVTVGNTTKSIVTGHWWILYTYEGFLLSAEGGAELLFNCSPDDFFGEAVDSLSWMWLLAACLMSLMLLMVAFFCIVVMHKKRFLQREDVVSSPPNSLVYEEFDEEMLARIRQKVETLREGRVSESSESGGKGNHYVLQMTPLEDSPVADTCRKGAEEPDVDHYKVPVSHKKEGRFHQGLLVRQDYCNNVHLDENHYEIIYPLDNSTPLCHGVPKYQTRKASMKPRSHIVYCQNKGDFSSEESHYENLYMAP